MKESRAHFKIYSEGSGELYTGCLRRRSAYCDKACGGFWELRASGQKVGLGTVRCRDLAGTTWG